MQLDITQKARKKTKTQFMGIGCVIQGAGLLFPGLAYLIGGKPLLIYGIGAMIALLLIGSQMAIKRVCSSCNNPLPGKSVKMCPVCRVVFR